VPYITIDKKGNILSINQAGVKILHSTIDSLLQSNFLNRLVASEKSDISIIVSKIKAGLTLNDVELALRPDNREDVWVLFSSHTNKQTGQTTISLVDVTQAKKVDEAKSEFVALATHQLRTPIAAIRWNTELLKKRVPDSLSESTERYFAKINRNVDRMTSLINDFLNVSKLELGTFATEQKVIYLKDFVDNAIDEFNDKFEQKFITLERNELPLDFSFVTDERLFQIIISNLLSNAVKYVKESGTIWFTTQVHNNMLTIQVADNGIGIPVNEIDSLFTKFYRATNAKSQQTQGTGLGLYIVKQAVEQLGGTISVMSDFDKGAAFTVALPLRDLSKV
jgi:signal transduction histidine kinase